MLLEQHLALLAQGIRIRCPHRQRAHATAAEEVTALVHAHVDDILRRGQIQRYLANQSPIPLDLTPPEDIVDMSVDDAGYFQCMGGGTRVLPVWTSNPDALCQQSQQYQQQQSNNPFAETPQEQQAPAQQQQQQPQQEEKSDGVAGWIKDMFGSN